MNSSVGPFEGTSVLVDNSFEVLRIICGRGGVEEVSCRTGDRTRLHCHKVNWDIFILSQIMYLLSMREMVGA